ncbi:MAG: NAD(P)/FAD-dependent oxidoreductase [Rhodobacteraceae bacterium]|nr:NAD(P)/FAD-dependent oxidoreductase [Paracoccaceae bacterium]
MAELDRVPADLDVLIIGAGISGIDAAYHLKTFRPQSRFAVVDTKPDIGGTWATHSFPGIRSDSDLHTFGFGWKPWRGPTIATAAEIKAYLTEAIAENDLRPYMAFKRHVTRADWDSAAQSWTVEIAGPAGPETCRAGFLWVCAGYYRHDAGYMPDFPGRERFAGPVVHPQRWPDDLDVTDKHVVVIGSGATAATLVPAIADKTRLVTVLQRSPTYYYARPSKDPFLDQLRALDLPPDWLHEIMRRKVLADSQQIAERSRTEPDALAAELIAGARLHLGKTIDVEKHFTPRYPPWRQRLAMVPDGDFLKAIRRGKADIVTDEIATFTETGIELASGQSLEADVIVSATGLELNFLGDIPITVDGAGFDPAQSVTHRGIMLSDLPNLALVFGYLRSSWTLRSDMVSTYLIRLFAHMDTRGAKTVTPELRDAAQMPRKPWVDPENFNPGYMLRALDRLPKQGDAQPWIMTQDYFRDREDLPKADLEDGTLVYR